MDFEHSERAQQYITQVERFTAARSGFGPSARQHAVAAAGETERIGLISPARACNVIAPGGYGVVGRDSRPGVVAVS